jgi:hypothetical protein
MEHSLCRESTLRGVVTVKREYKDLLAVFVSVLQVEHWKDHQNARTVENIGEQPLVVPFDPVKIFLFAFVRQGGAFRPNCASSARVVGKVTSYSPEPLSDFVHVRRGVLGALIVYPKPCSILPVLVRQYVHKRLDR